jgi:RNA polymerase sigma factor (sigma-70 family)
MQIPHGSLRRNDFDACLITSIRVQEGSQEAFQEIVVEHLGLVYGVALRCLNGDAALAEDACQIVFQSLAQKARSIPPDTIITGWLYRHAFHTASRMARAEQRRRRREARAVAEHDMASEKEPHSLNAIEQAAAELLAGLPSADREASKRLGDCSVFRKTRRRSG